MTDLIDEIIEQKCTDGDEVPLVHHNDKHETITASAHGRTIFWTDSRQFFVGENIDKSKIGFKVTKK
jgi:hypothetical protein